MPNEIDSLEAYPPFTDLDAAIERLRSRSFSKSSIFSENGSGARRALIARWFSGIFFH